MRWTGPRGRRGSGQRIRTSSDAGNAADGAHFSYTVVPDVSRPTVEIAVPVTGARLLKGSLVNVSYTCSDVGTGLAGCDADVANGSPLDTSTAGSHYFTVTAFDRAGLVTRVVVPYTVYADTSKPTITITTPGQGATYRKGQILHAAFTCRDESGGSELASCTGTTPDNGLIDSTRVGRYTLRVTATDNAGNRRTQTVAYRVVADKTKPTIFIFAPTEGAPYRVGQLPTFEFSCNDDPDGQVLSESCVGSLDGQPVATGSQASLPDIPAGSHTWRVDATDLAGNTASTTVHFTVKQ